MNTEELREYSKKLAYSGEEFHQIKEELMKLNLESGLVELILGEVDQNIVEYQLILQEKERLLNQMIIGALFFFNRDWDNSLYLFYLTVTVHIDVWSNIGRSLDVYRKL